MTTSLSITAAMAIFGYLSGINELLLLSFEVCIEARGDPSWHLEGLLHIGSATADVAFTFPLPGLVCGGGKASQCSCLPVLKTAAFGVGGDELAGGQCSHARDAGQDLAPGGECGVG